jgi:Asp/Glu/hydantoin racemase
MRTVALINPNSSAATTTTLTAVAQRALGSGYRVRGIAARTGPELIQDEAALSEAAREVLAIGRHLLADRAAPDALIVAAFGDPDVDLLRGTTGIPTVGIAEAAIREASTGGRRFGIATTTPGLVDVITARVSALHAQEFFTGIRLTSGDAEKLMADPDRLHDCLTGAVHDCVHLDHAEAVIIGGGPLAAAAERLQSVVGVPVIAPVPSACRAVSHILTVRSSA